jgi:hypothetical protein
MISSVTFTAVIQRLKEALNRRNDKEVAEILRIKPNAFYNRRRLGSLPFQELLNVAEGNDLSADWLFFGRGTPTRKPGGNQKDAQPNVDPALMGEILFALEREQERAEVKESDSLEAAARRGLIAAQIYNEVFLMDDTRKRSAAVKREAEEIASAARLLQNITKAKRQRRITKKR